MRSRPSTFSTTDRRREPVLACLVRWSDVLASQAGRRLGFLVFLVALVPRFLMVLLFPSELRYPDEEVYLMLAQSLLANGEYEVGWPDLWSNNQFSGVGAPPMQSFVILVGLIVGGGGIWGAKLIMALFGAGTAALTSLLGNRLFGGRAAVVAGLVCAVYPLLLFINNTLFPQTLAAFLLLLLILALVPPEGYSRRRVLGGGLALGALILTVPAFAPLSPMFALWVLLGARRMGSSWARAVGMVVLLALGASVVVLPWTVRTSLRYREFILVSACSAIPLWDGNLGVYPMMYVKELRPLSPQQRDAFLRKIAWARMTKDPADTAGRIGTKFVQFFGLWDRQLKSTRWSKFGYKVLGAATSAPVLLGALWGSRRALRRNPHVAWILATVLLTAALYAVFLAKIRYRLSVEPLIMVLAAAALPVRPGEGVGNGRP